MNIRYWLWVQLSPFRKKKRRAAVLALEVEAFSVAWASARAQMIESLNQIGKYLDTHE